MTDDGTLPEQVQNILDEAVAERVTPGAVCRIHLDGEAELTVTAGRLATHDERGEALSPGMGMGPAGTGPAETGPHGTGTPVTTSTVYDLASVTKVFTAITVLCLVDQGVLDLTTGIGEWLPQYRDAPKSAVTLAHLLSHTSGLPAVWPGGWQHVVDDYGTDHASWQPPGRERVLGDILDLELKATPGENVEYSCLGYITAMAAAESATRMPWPRLVADRVLTPLGLRETTFVPEVARTAPTEFQPKLGRGLVRALVHDETAHALEGISGNAGLFATAADLGRLADATLHGLGDVLSPEMFARFWEDQLPSLLGAERARDREAALGFGQSLGMRIGQTTWMGEHGRNARGHTGFTGTSLLVDRDAGLTVVLLTNRVHPSRELSDVAPLRRAVAEAAYGQR